MSHQDYIESCDEDQLACLIEMAESKLKQIRDEGFVEMWVVGDDWCNYKWFHLKDYDLALEFLVEYGKNSVKEGREDEIKITKEKIRPSEVDSYVSGK